MEKKFRIPIKTQILIVEAVIDELDDSREHREYPVFLCPTFKRIFATIGLYDVPFYFVIKFATLKLARLHGADTNRYYWWNSWNKYDRIEYLEDVLSKLKAYKRYGFLWRLFY